MPRSTSFSSTGPPQKASSGLWKQLGVTFTNPEVNRKWLSGCFWRPVEAFWGLVWPLIASRRLQFLANQTQGWMGGTNQAPVNTGAQPTKNMALPICKTLFWTIPSGWYNTYNLRPLQVWTIRPTCMKSNICKPQSYGGEIFSTESISWFRSTGPALCAPFVPVWICSDEKRKNCAPGGEGEQGWQYHTVLLKSTDQPKLNWI